MATSLLSGVAFGAALTASGVYHPSVILEQLKLADWSMLETFLTATASSTLLISAFHAANLVKLAPRSYSGLGFFAHYDGNILGGALLGAGMALSSSCPGTVLAQIGAGIWSNGLPTLVGAMLAGILWTGYLRPWLLLRTCKLGEGHEGSSKKRERSKTVHEALGISKYIATAAFEGLLGAAVAGLTWLSIASRAPSSSLPDGGSAPWSETIARAARPAAGGLLIGLAQLASLLLRGSAVGVSAAYEDAGEFVWWPFYSPGSESDSESESDSSSASKDSRPILKSSSILFATGIVFGSRVLAVLTPGLLDTTSAIPDIPVWQAVLGGFLMVTGARVAGGCTSGHGITGMSLLSVSSFVTIGSALAVGVLTARTFL
ncbi:hypothetical protein B0T16DRAFT_73309 [Cercophora newfieldiana]|uniref:Sulphur transport domain-containing protein n=1 Tax=Cercophora newfieldiana TaxID=92897 RepID=A0AA39YFW3_9PEZI|nr:hypothetical protein B0T16DRAFT_73309 [Cercophora newfieldiana]